MILHDLTPGMHPRRVRIFIAEKGLSIERREVDAAGGANMTLEFLRLNPLGKLPVLELDDGSAIAESLAICRYLEALHPQPPLMGQTPQASAQIEMWTLRMDLELSRMIGETFRHGGEYFRGELAQRPFIAGDDYTLADIVAQCACVLGKATGLRIPVEFTNLSRWFADVTARPTARA
ncbi:MAG: glutathione S-transferase family protein [Betaproteobacteria bacterium]|nr:glutathione S-transferase family protein [Betaproteobacteria bacterium]